MTAETLGTKLDAQNLRRIRLWLRRLCLLVPAVLIGCAQAGRTPNAYVRRCTCQCQQCQGNLDPVTHQCPPAALRPEQAPRFIDYCFGADVTDQDQNAICQQACLAKPYDASLHLPAGTICDQVGTVTILNVQNGVEEQACVSDPGDHRIYAPDPPFVTMTLDETRSFLHMHADYRSGTTSLSGELGLSGGNCPGGSCAMRLENGVFRAPNFDLHRDYLPPDIHVRRLFGLLLGQPEATVEPDGTFTIDAGSVGVLVAGNARKPHVYNQDFTADVYSSSDATGWFDYASRELHLHASLQQDDVSLTVDVVATWDNLPPLVQLSAESDVVECDAPGTGTVRVTGDVSDSDGSVAESYWVIDGWYSGDGLVSEHHLSLGEHDIALWAVDNDGALSVDAVTVEVVDTTPPVIGPGEAALFCTWPPNHKYVKLSVDNQVLVSDVCDPNPEVHFIDATSSEPDNGLGDGDTTNDVILMDGEGVCLRSERSGTGEGRTYTVSVQAEDHSGNSSGSRFDVAVFHDEGVHDCPRLPSRAFVNPGDEAVECPVDPDSAVKKSESRSGCSTGGTGGGWAFLLLWATMAAVRRRKAGGP